MAAWVAWAEWTTKVPPFLSHRNYKKPGWKQPGFFVYTILNFILVAAGFERLN